jgi:proline iminopeptidase
MRMKYLIILCCLFAVPAFASEHRVVTSDGVSLYVEIRGEGEPCLYIHGGPGSGSYWLRKFSGDMLEKRFTMIYLDQRGVGRSKSPANGDYSLARMIKDFEEIRTQLGIEQWFTLGHSFGGVLQVPYIEQYPQHHLGMVMLNTTLNISQSMEDAMPKIKELLGLQEASLDLDTSKTPLERIMPYLSQLREKDLFWKMQYLSKDNEVTMNATYNDIPDWNGEFGVAAMSIHDYYQNFKPATADIKAPVLYFYGRQDWIVGAHHYRDIAFPNMLLWESPAGHVPFMEDKEGLAKAIDQFLTMNW